MPVVIRLRLIPRVDTQLRLENAPGQAWFLALVDRFHAQWAEDLHGVETGARAYTVSPFYQPLNSPLADGDTIGDRALRSGRLRADETIALRVSIADEAKGAALLTALPRLAEALPALGGARCRLERIPRAALDDPDLLVTDWQRLAAAPPARKLYLEFTTPTTFISQGEQSPMPTPERLWRSWLMQWTANTGSAPYGPTETGWVYPRISAYNLHTAPFRLKGGVFIGFVGELVLSFASDVPAGIRSGMTALAGIADFFGTGAKTTMGMGQTRLRVDEDSQ